MEHGATCTKNVEAHIIHGNIEILSDFSRGGGGHIIIGGEFYMENYGMCVCACLYVLLPPEEL